MIFVDLSPELFAGKSCVEHRHYHRLIPSNNGNSGDYRN